MSRINLADASSSQTSALKVVWLCKKRQYVRHITRSLSSNSADTIVHNSRVLFACCRAVRSFSDLLTLLCGDFIVYGS